MTERILFFASGDFPVKTFKSLIEKRYNIVGLVTSYDKHTFKNKDIEKLSDIAVSNNIVTLFYPLYLGVVHFADKITE